jgi:hypothetical protein
MAEGNVSRVLHGPGRMVVNPTDLGLDYPFGGTPVGLVRAMVLQSSGNRLAVESEGLGAVQDVLEPSERVLASWFLRGWDDDGIALFRPGEHSTGGVSGHAKLTIPGSTQPGASALPRALSILWVPNNEVDVPAMLLHRALVFWTEGSEIAYQRAAELGVALVADCLRDDSGRAAQIGRLSDLSL